MTKTILITGATSGIGLETARMLLEAGHRVLLHGRNADSLDEAARTLQASSGGREIERYAADLLSLHAVDDLAKAIAARHDTLDVLVNNAGVYSTPELVTGDGLDVRFAVNTIAPWLLTRRLLPLMGTSGRVINLSSAAQAPVDPRALSGETRLGDGEAYAQSKLALTMWTGVLARALGDEGPAVIAVNPGSMLGSKMVKEAFGVAGGDLGIGARVLVRAALDDEFAKASGQYFDNDAGRFADPHRDALDTRKANHIASVIESVIASVTPPLAPLEPLGQNDHTTTETA